MNNQPHSADYFGDTRDFWWNRDFLELMAARWNLASVRKALDVGCGIGHWGRCLAPLLPAGCELIGLDREVQWVEEAQRRSAGIENIVVSFQQGEAERLPFPNGSFDLVTCQTVLIHVKDPVAVIREMIRVLVPGGLLVIVEPNNFASSASTFDMQRPIEKFIRFLEFQMICERGKMILGEGFNSIGTFIPGWLSELGIEHIESYVSDKTTRLAPPYTSAHERALVRECEEIAERQFWIWNREDTLRYFVAGGGLVDTFEHRWREALARDVDFLNGLKRGERRDTFAPVCLLTSGRKPISSTAAPTVPSPG